MGAADGSAKRWTTRQLLNWTRGYFERQGLEAPRRAAEMLLAHVLETPRLKLYMEPDRPASPEERAAFRALVARAARHEPVDYLVGQSPFFSLLFRVTPDVLIPRPSTEALVEHVLQHARRAPGMQHPRIADVGTGSGCIAVAVAKHLPGSRVIATDTSDRALAVARTNAQAHGVDDRVELRNGDLLEPLRHERLDYLLANPPYIGSDAWAELPAHIRNYEPVEALWGGPDGLAAVSRLIAEGPDLLEPGGQLAVEIADEQKAIARERARVHPLLERAQVLGDHEGLPRVLVADRCAEAAVEGAAHPAAQAEHRP